MTPLTGIAAVARRGSGTDGPPRAVTARGAPRPGLAAAVRQGIAEAEAGATHDLGSFRKFAHEDGD